MSDFLLGVASPEFWRDCGFALSATGVIGIVAVIIFPDDKRRLQKGLALAFVALLLVGYAFARFGESALLAEARERADEAEVELARHRASLAPDAQRRLTAQLRQFAGQEFTGQVAPGSDDARGLWEALDPALAAAGWVRVAPYGFAIGNPPAGVPLAPNSGVTVFVAASRANELAPIVQALAGALMAEGIIAGVSASAGPQMEGRPNVIVIEIGRKP